MQTTMTMRQDYQETMRGELGCGARDTYRLRAIVMLWALRRYIRSIPERITR